VGQEDHNYKGQNDGEEGSEKPHTAFEFTSKKAKSASETGLPAPAASRLMGNFRPGEMGNFNKY
jgi:hypothetical protein